MQNLKEHASTLIKKYPNFKNEITNIISLMEDEVNSGSSEDLETARAYEQLEELVEKY